ncbi:hypothetical protein [Staphylococcus epidermidis]
MQQNRQFSIVEYGQATPNYFAIIAMLIGYVLLPLLLFIANKKYQKQH